MQGFMARAMKAGLAKVGEPSLLDGQACGNVALLRNVEVVTGNRTTEDDNYVGLFDLALIDSAYAPQIGSVLVHPDGRYRLDRLVHDNGATRQFIALAQP